MKKLVHIFLTFLALLLLGSGAIYAAGSDTSSENVILVEVNGDVISQYDAESYFVIGGEFTQIKIDGSSPISRSNIAAIRKDTRALSSWNPVLNGAVTDIVESPDFLILSGEFTKVNDIEQPHLAIFKKSDLTFSQKQYDVNAPVYSLSVYDDKTLFLGGAFTQIESQERPYLASIVLSENKVGTWSPAPNSTVYASVIHNNYLYVGGDFTRIAGEDRQYIASFYLPSGELSSWNPGAAAPVQSIEIQGETILIQTMKEGTEELSSFSLDADTTTITDAVSTQDLTGVSAEEEATVAGLMIDTEELGFQIPTLADVLTFAIRAFFVVAGLTALFYLLLGAFAWVTSGGDKDSISAAREKIQAAIIGLIMMVVVLALVWTMEQVIFKRRICLGLSCPLTLPSLIEPIDETTP